MSRADCDSCEAGAEREFLRQEREIADLRARLAAAERERCAELRDNLIRDDARAAALFAAADATRERDEARAQLDALSAWTRTYGAALCPTTGHADTFGDGMRAAKRQIAALLTLAGKDGAK